MATTQQNGVDSETRSALRDALAQIVRRLWRVRWLRLASRGALIATCLSLLAVGLAHGGLLPTWLPLELMIPVLLLLGVGLGTLFASVPPIDPMTAARHVEARLGLKERLSSALEFERSGQRPHDPEAALLLRLQQEDAAAHALALHPADAVPIRLPWESKAFLAAFLLLLLALILPALPVFVPPAVRSERAVVKKSGKELTRTARVIEKRAAAQGLPATKRAAQNMRKLGQHMAQGRMDKKQAMVQTAQLSKQMADEQRRLAQANSATPQDGKSLAQAGEQMAQSLQKPAHGQSPPGTPEMQKAAQSLKQGSASGLSEQLRNLAQRTAAHPMSPGSPRQAAQDLQKLSDALKGTPLSETQKHAQSAADALKRGDPQRAAAEMRQAADAADRQTQQQRDAQGLQDAQQSLQNGQQQMAQASSPSDISHRPSDHADAPSTPGVSNAQGKPNHGLSSGASQGRSNGKSNATGQNGGHVGNQQGGAPGNLGGSGPSSPTRPGLGRSAPEAGQGEQTPSHDTGVVRGAPHPLDPKFDPAKNPKYGKIYLGAGDGSSGGQTGRLLKASPGARPPVEPRVGSVPYYNALAPARKSAESTMDKEDIPPAYRSSVRRYFDSLQPPAVGKP